MEKKTWTHLRLFLVVFGSRACRRRRIPQGPQGSFLVDVGYYRLTQLWLLPIEATFADTVEFV